MLYVKKYFMEGLIQMAILLSLCGVRVEVGLEPYLPPSWHEMILGPTSALTQTQFHNLHNSLDDGHGLHPKNVDVDSFFTARRLLGWVRSLDRLQVPPAGLETWLVQREPDPLPVGWPSRDREERADALLEGDRTDPPVELRPGPGTLEEEEEADEFSDAPRREDLEPPQTSDMELHWQDLLSIMEPESKDSDVTIDDTEDSRPPETLCWVGSEVQNHNFENHYSVEADQHGWMGSLRQPGQEQVLLPLTPSAELDKHSLAFSSSDMKTLRSPPHHTDLLAEDLPDDFCMELNGEYNSSTFNLNLLEQDLENSVEYTPKTENLASFHSRDLKPSTSATSLGRKDVSQDGLTSPFSIFLSEKEEEFEDEDDLLSPLGDLLEDVASLDEIRLLDLALDDGFSPEMAAVIGEEFYSDHDVTEPNTGSCDDKCELAVTEDKSQPRRPPQDGEKEPDSDSGLSLDFSHSPVSPCVSETSSYSSSMSSTSDSSLSCVSAVESPFFSDQEDDAEMGLASSDMDVEVPIKQEEDEEEMGAVGGWYPADVTKVLPASYEDHKLFNGFLWQEHVDHDHTYNQPRSSGSSASLDEMPTKSTKSLQRRHHSKPHYCSTSRLHSKTNGLKRDEWRARALKLPFSNEQIVNLPVEEFNDLLTNSKLCEDQVALIRDIRRRGKNKIAAQNCRKRKLDVLLGLEEEVSAIRRRRARLLREKQEALKKLQELKRHFDTLHQEVFSSLRDGNGRPLDSAEYLLDFGPDGRVTLTSQQQRAKSKKQGSDKNH